MKQSISVVFQVLSVVFQVLSVVFQVLSLTFEGNMATKDQSPERVIPSEELGDDDIDQVSESIAQKVIAKIKASLGTSGPGQVTPSVGEASGSTTGQEGKLFLIRPGPC